jgi:predicted amino acid-binding ACT domain protein
MQPLNTELILIRITGEDRPGLTASVTEILAKYDATILDIGQADIHNTLSLGILCKTEEQHSGFIMKELLFKASSLGVTVRFYPITAKEYDTSSGSEALCTIIDNQHPEVEFKILESEVALVSKGDKVQVSPYAMSSFTSTGTITEINPLIDKNGMLYIKALLPASDKLIDGMNVKILIQRHI